MKILVTGSAGYVGSALVPYLDAAGHEVIEADVVLHNEAPYLGDAAILNVPKEIDAIINLAGMTLNGCESSPGEAEYANVKTADNMARQSCDWSKPADYEGHRKRLIHFSTCSVYGDRGEEAIDEESLVAPTSIYSQTKLKSEKRVLEAGGIVFRMATICGVTPKTRYDTMVNEWTSEAVKTGFLRIYQPQAWRPFVHIRDVLTAVDVALRDRRLRGVYNVVGDNLRKSELFDKILEVCPDARAELSYGDADPRCYRVSSMNFMRKTGWRPMFDVSDAVRDIVHSLS